jgi:hypothetical protein
MREEFKQAKAEQVTFKDSRFGIRRLFINRLERPRIGTYDTPGKGVQGESQN